MALRARLGQGKLGGSKKCRPSGSPTGENDGEALLCGLGLISGVSVCGKRKQPGLGLVGGISRRRRRKRRKRVRSNADEPNGTTVTGKTETGGGAGDKKVKSWDELMTAAVGWAEFMASLRRGTRSSFIAAIQKGRTLIANGIGLDVVLPFDSADVFACWAREPRDDGSIDDVADAGTSPEPGLNAEEKRALTEEMWEVLVAANAVADGRVNNLCEWLAQGQRATPLHVACANGSITAVKLLLNQPDIDVNVQCCEHFETALMTCIRYSDTNLESAADCFQMILRKKLLEMDLDLTDVNGSTIQDLIDQEKFEKRDLKIYAYWNTAVHWLRHTYFPTLHRSLKHLTKLPLPLVVLIDSFILPKSIYPR
jgi:hypothetical protein